LAALVGERRESPEGIEWARDESGQREVGVIVCENVEIE
jgi:hypothetical protein